VTRSLINIETALMPPLLIKNETITLNASMKFRYQLQPVATHFSNFCAVVSLKSISMFKKTNETVKDTIPGATQS
jgi:hypothetical protein